VKSNLLLATGSSLTNRDRDHQGQPPAKGRSRKPAWKQPERPSRGQNRVNGGSDQPRRSIFRRAGRERGQQAPPTYERGDKTSSCSGHSRTYSLPLVSSSTLVTGLSGLLVRRGFLLSRGLRASNPDHVGTHPVG